MGFAIRQFGLAALAAGVLTLALSSDSSAQRRLSFAYDQPVTTAYGHAVPVEYRGIGVRIEDDALITDGGCEVLTAGTPKTVDEVERACAESPRLTW